MSETARAIHSLMPKVSADIGAVSKDRLNEQQRFKFRGIDDIISAVHTPLITHGISVTCRAFDITREERTTKNGAAMTVTFLSLEVTYTAPDGSFVQTTVPGEAMDMADKSSNKAMSAALKYAHIMTFSIPVELDDADQVTPDVAPRVAKSNGNGHAKAEPPKQEPAKADPPKREEAKPTACAMLRDLLHNGQVFGREKHALHCGTKEEADAIVRHGSGGEHMTYAAIRENEGACAKVLAAMNAALVDFPPEQIKEAALQEPVNA